MALRRPVLVVVGALAITVATARHASAQVFTDSAAFNAALSPGAYFNSLGGTTGTSFSGGSGPFAYTVSAPSGVYNGPTLIGANLPNEPFTFTFTSGAPNAVGGSYYGTNISDAFVGGLPITLTYSDGFVDTYTPASASEFRGYISAVPLTSVISSVPAASGAYTSNSNVTVGVSPVPEPTSMGLAAFGIAVGAAFRRRFRRTGG